MRRAVERPKGADATNGRRIRQIEPWHRFYRGVSSALQKMADRVDRALFVTREGEIRAFWRAQEASQRSYWARRGYTDAQTGHTGYPHHGGCQCTWCGAYWVGYRRYLRHENPPVPKQHAAGPGAFPNPTVRNLILNPAGLRSPSETPEAQAE